MSEKLKFIKVVIFAQDNYVFQMGDPNGVHRQTEILLPLEAIACLTPRDKGNPHSGYNVHIKKSYWADFPFPTKSVNPSYLSAEQVEVLKLS